MIDALPNEPEPGFEVCAECLKFVEEDAASRVTDVRRVTLSSGEPATVYDHTFYCAACFKEVYR